MKKIAGVEFREFDDFKKSADEGDRVTVRSIIREIGLYGLKIYTVSENSSGDKDIEIYKKYDKDELPESFSYLLFDSKGEPYPHKHCLLFTVEELSQNKLYDIYQELNGNVTVSTEHDTKKQKEVTIKYAAACCDVSEQTIKNWDKGKHRPEGWPGRDNMTAFLMFSDQYKALKGLRADAREKIGLSHVVM